MELWPKEIHSNFQSFTRESIWKMNQLAAGNAGARFREINHNRFSEIQPGAGSLAAFEISAISGASVQFRSISSHFQIQSTSFFWNLNYSLKIIIILRERKRKRKRGGGKEKRHKIKLKWLLKGKWRWRFDVGHWLKTGLCVRAIQRESIMKWRRQIPVDSVVFLFDVLIDSNWSGERVD